MPCKHRGIEKRYEGMTGGDGVLLAERTEGIAAVAYVLAFCQAAERIAGCQPTRTARLARVLHLPAGVRFCQPGLQGFRGLRSAMIVNCPLADSNRSWLTWVRLTGIWAPHVRWLPPKTVSPRDRCRPSRVISLTS
jgi:hypothetical protein